MNREQEMQLENFRKAVVVVVGVVLLLAGACRTRGSDPLGDSGPLTPHDPWGRESYEALVAVADAHRIGGILTVGIPDRHVGGGLPHCRVPGGFRNLPDGEYVVAGGVVIPVRWLWW